MRMGPRAQKCAQRLPGHNISYHPSPESTVSTVLSRLRGKEISYRPSFKGSKDPSSTVKGPFTLKITVFQVCESALRADSHTRNTVIFNVNVVEDHCFRGVRVRPHIWCVVRKFLTDPASKRRYIQAFRGYVVTKFRTALTSGAW